MSNARPGAAIRSEDDRKERVCLQVMGGVERSTYNLPCVQLGATENTCLHSSTSTKKLKPGLEANFQALWKTTQLKVQHKSSSPQKMIRCKVESNSFSNLPRTPPKLTCPPDSCKNAPPARRVLWRDSSGIKYATNHTPHKSEIGKRKTAAKVGAGVATTVTMGILALVTGPATVVVGGLATTGTFALGSAVKRQLKKQKLAKAAAAKALVSAPPCQNPPSRSFPVDVDA